MALTKLISTITCCLLLFAGLVQSISWFGIDNHSNRITRGQNTACQTLPSTVHVVKEEYNNDGMLGRSCEGDLSVTKCEGTCISKVTPSVVTPNGFLKVNIYKHLRELSIIFKEIFLIDYFFPEGLPLL